MNKLIVLLSLFELVAVSLTISFQPRIKYGSVVDTLKRFPHHVSIEPITGWNTDGYRSRLCGGSIINKNWILTSSSCVEQSNRLNLNMHRLYKNDTSGSFTIVVNNNPSNVVIYPTEYDDVALIKLPIDLIFSDTIKPIVVSHTSVSELQNKLAVLPGFDTSDFYPVTPTPPVPNYKPRTDSLTYAMLSIQSNNVCQSYFESYYGSNFDEYLHICTKGWGNNLNVPCLVDSGSGLVADWPAHPRLIGVYSAMSYDCNSKGPARFINIQKYSDWIDDVVANY